jgi:diguanylate cyclase (GGDEF)-like protein
MLVHLRSLLSLALIASPLAISAEAAPATSTITPDSLTLAAQGGALLAILLSCAFCFFAIAWHQRSGREALWLALVLTGLAALTALHPGMAALLPFEPDAILRQRVALLAAAWTPAALLLYYHASLPLRLLPSLLPITLIGAGLLCSVVALLPAEALVSLVWPLITWWGLHLALAALVLADAVRRRQHGATRLLLSLVPVLLAACADLWNYGMPDGNLITTPPVPSWSPYAFALFVLAQIWIYMEKFIATHSLAARLKHHLQEEVSLRTRELLLKNRKLEEAQSALEEANAALKKLSITDGLTRVHNRMYFEQQLAQEWRRCGRQGLPLSVLMVDADHFKQLNDSAGHLAGDHCLMALAETLRQQFRRSGELVARYGGEEFVVLLPDCNQTQALALAEGLRIAVEQLTIRHAGEHYRITVSIGVSTTVPGTEAPESLLAAADNALYDAKANGRNRVHVLPLLGPRHGANQQQLHL